jgi:hypothetical protein
MLGDASARSYGDKNKSDRTLPWCPEHGIRLHSNTFAYWNGPGRFDEARLRNFIVGHDLVRAIALPKGMKAEAHRLGLLTRPIPVVQGTDGVEGLC